MHSRPLAVAVWSPTLSTFIPPAQEAGPLWSADAQARVPGADRPVRRTGGLGGPAASLPLPVGSAQQPGRGPDHHAAAATTGNLLGIEPELIALDYGNPERLRLKLDAYLANARRLGLIGAQTIVVLPEHLGTPLALMGEKPEVYAAARSEDAIQWLLLGNPLRVARAWFQAEGDRRLADSLLRMKAWDMASAYQQLFGGLARQYGVTLVAGSIVLPGPTLVDGELQVGTGPLRNVTLVFGPDGRCSASRWCGL